MTTRIALLGLLALSACGGGSNMSGGGAPATNAFTGTVTVTSALAAGTTTCQGANQVVRFKALGAGADVHTVTVAGGGCIQFQNDDAAPHQVAARAATAGCAGLNAPGATPAAGSYVAGPLGSAAGPVTCDWMDALTPPGNGGGGY